jgi:hypothetical protein
LHYELGEPNPISILDINSPLIGDMCDKLCKHVLDVPCVEQPIGHSCGTACNINAALALEVGTFEKLLDKGIEKVLAKYKLPARTNWTNWDFTAASNVLIEKYEKSVDEIPALPELLIEMSTEIRQARENAAKEKKARDEQLKKLKEASSKRKRPRDDKTQGKLSDYFSKKAKTDEPSKSKKNGKKKKSKKRERRSKVSPKKREPKKSSKGKKKTSPRKKARK